jgi:hypothetical protein
MLASDEERVGIYANDTDFEFYEDRPPVFCFYCSEPLTEQVKVYWHGCDPIGRQGLDLALHADCAAGLALHLASDSLKANNPLLRSKTENATIERQRFNRQMKQVPGFSPQPGEYR